MLKRKKKVSENEGFDAEETPKIEEKPAKLTKKEQKKQQKEAEKRQKETEKTIEKEVRERVNARSKQARFADFFAFCALALAAFLFALGPLLRWIFEATGGENILITLNTIAQYCLLGAVALPAWYFVRRKNHVFIAIFIIVIVIYVVGIVLGLI